MEPSDVYDLLLATGKSEDEIENGLIDMVILACDHTAETVNSHGELEQILWLTGKGYTADEIKEFVSKS
jgi:hypothetical protein